MSTSISEAIMVIEPQQNAVIRAQFPALAHNRKGNKPLVYLDSAASSLKPQAMIDAINIFYSHDYANIHRGIYDLSLKSTQLFEKARLKMANLLGCEEDPAQIIFTKGSTEGINLLASSLGTFWLQAGDQIVLSDMEHHANLVPWQQLAQRSQAELVFLPISHLASVDTIDEQWLSQYLTNKTKILSITGMSNVTGAIIPLERICGYAKHLGAIVIVDAAQLACHRRIDSQKIPFDFLVLSGHKLLGPSGIGILFGRRALLEQMPPYQTGGDMIWRVTKQSSTWSEIPAKFEAGTPPIAQAIGLAAAIDYMDGIGFEQIAKYEQRLVKIAREKLSNVQGVTLYCDENVNNQGGVLSFTLRGVHPHDIGTILARDNIAIRVGHHCCQVLMQEWNIAATCRISFSVYSSLNDIDRFIEAMVRVQEIFGE